MPVRKGPECVGDEMRRFRRGELHSGKGGKVVTDPKQAKAISLSACGQSKYVESLLSIGYSEETANAVSGMLYGELDWQKQFETGKGPGSEKTENYDTGLSKKPGRGQLLISPTGVKGDAGKQKVNDEASMLTPTSYPRGPGNPQGGSSKEVTGMRMLG